MSGPETEAVGFHKKASLNSLHSAAVVVPLLLDVVDVGSVVDFGCKHGEWLQLFQQNGVNRVLGIDRRDDAALLLIAAADFRAADLSRPFALDSRFDLAVCIEVAEHLPRVTAQPLIDTLTTTAPLVLFSAAVPGQGGHGHLNEQPRSYWDRMFEWRGFRRLD